MNKLLKRILLKLKSILTIDYLRITSNTLVVRQQEEQTRAMKMKNEFISKHISIHKELVNMRMLELKSELKKGIKNDDKIRIIIKELSELMVKGLEIYSSIDSPKEIRDLFPTSDELISLPEPAKLIKGDKTTE